MALDKQRKKELASSLYADVPTYGGISNSQRKQWSNIRRWQYGSGWNEKSIILYEADEYEFDSCFATGLGLIWWRLLRV